MPLRDLDTKRPTLTNSPCRPFFLDTCSPPNHRVLQSRSLSLSCLATVLVSQSARHFYSDIYYARVPIPTCYIIKSCDQHVVAYIFVTCLSYWTFLATRVCTSGLKLRTNAQDSHEHQCMGFEIGSSKMAGACGILNSRSVICVCVSALYLLQCLGSLIHCTSGNTSPKRIANNRIGSPCY